VITEGVFILALAVQGAPAEGDVASLILRLSSDRPEERSQAADALRSLGDRAVPALQKARDSGDLELRLRACELLNGSAAISALVEDLRSDDIPGNAKSARNALLRRYDGGVKRALLEAIRSDDPQQAIQAAFVLVNKGEAGTVWQAEPKLLSQAIGMFMRGEDDGFHWVAAQVLLRLGLAAGPIEEAAAYRKALAGVAPSAMTGSVRQLGGMCRELKRPFPRPLLRRYLENLRDDNRDFNAGQAAQAIRFLNELAVPELKAVVADPDAQARHYSLSLLLDLQVKDLTPVALPVLGELLGRDPRAIGRLVEFGDAALPTLEDRIESRDPPTALRAAEGLALLAHDRWWKRAAQVAIANLQTDNFEGNAREAAGFLVRLGPDVAPLLREALLSDDEQVVVCAAGVLGCLGQPVAPEKRTIDQIVRFASAQYCHDEGGALEETLARSTVLRAEVLDRLARSGREGRMKAKGLEERLSVEKRESWIPASCGEIGGLIQRR
jgi:hypothetical protein